MEKYLEAGKTYIIKKPFTTGLPCFKGQEFTVINRDPLGNLYEVQTGKKIYKTWLVPENFEETITHKVLALLKD